MSYIDKLNTILEDEGIHLGPYLVRFFLYNKDSLPGSFKDFIPLDVKELQQTLEQSWIGILDDLDELKQIVTFRIDTDFICTYAAVKYAHYEPKEEEIEWDPESEELLDTGEQWESEISEETYNFEIVAWSKEYMEEYIRAWLTHYESVPSHFEDYRHILKYIEDIYLPYAGISL